MSNDVVAFDVESTTFQKGSPFSKRNKLCSVAAVSGDARFFWPIEHSGLPFGSGLAEIRELLEAANLVVTFNGKFDIHWLRRYIPNLRLKRVWDTQLAEFILSAQRSIMPSLDGTAEFYELPKKVDRVRTEYWERGFDTDQVPLEILKEYNLGDADLTYKIYLRQKSRLEGNQLKLFNLQCEDLLVLEEMEYNGMLFDSQEADRLAASTTEELVALRAELDGLVGVPDLNWNSNNHISAVLYGGIVNIPAKVVTERVLKSGEIKRNEVNGYRQVVLPRRVKPLPNTETKETKGKSDEYIAQENLRRSAEKKPILSRVFKVDEPTLQRLPKNEKIRRVLYLLSAVSEKDKLVGTYYKGIPELAKEMDWEDGKIHGQFNQCVAITGRLSSKEPNLQNFAGAIKPLFHSRYNN